MVNKAAQALGKLAAGKPKNFSAAERKRRAERLAAARAKRWPRKSNEKAHFSEVSNSERRIK